MSPRAGTPEFKQQLLKRTFKCCSARQVLFLPDGLRLYELLQSTQFIKPVVIERPDHLDMAVPPPSLTVSEAVRLAGAQREVDVINVSEQRDFSMRLSDFENWWYSDSRDPSGSGLLNLLSLEISDSQLGDMVQAPLAVRQLSLVNRCWPSYQLTKSADGGGAAAPVDNGQDAAEDLADDDEDFEKEEPPELLKYCLLSPAGSYTDFHIDFGGSSVWYHVLSGEKIFYLLPPTEANLKCYETWMQSKDNLTSFLGDRCQKQPKMLRVTEGQTVLLPSGWVHAVYTPADSMVFGGNFLHLYSLKTQIRIYKMELLLDTETRFQFPYFEKLHWLAAALICKEFSSDRNDFRNTVARSNQAGERERRSLCRFLHKVLTDWYENRSRAAPRHRRYFLPSSTEAGCSSIDISPAQLLSQLRQLSSSAKLKHARPPKRRSKSDRHCSSSSSSIDDVSSGSGTLSKRRRGHSVRPPPDVSTGEYQHMLGAFVKLDRLPELVENSPDETVSEPIEAASSFTESNGTGAIRKISPRRTKSEAILRLGIPQTGKQCHFAQQSTVRLQKLLPPTTVAAPAHWLCFECGHKCPDSQLLLLHHAVKHSRLVPSASCVCTQCWVTLPTAARIQHHILLCHPDLAKQPTVGSVAIRRAGDA